MIGKWRARQKLRKINKLSLRPDLRRKLLPGKERQPNASLTLISDKKREWKRKRSGPMGDASESIDGHAGAARIRVRTPGKHIVLFSLAVTFMIAISTLVLSRTDFALPEHPFAPVGPTLVEESFVADLAPDALGRLRLVRLVVGIEAPFAETRRTLEDKRPQLRERISFFLRELSPDDLDGADGHARLKAELLRRVNLTLAPEKTDDVVIQSLLIQ
jgi:flagellar basal body-associated protein FliL